MGGMRERRLDVGIGIDGDLCVLLFSVAVVSFAAVFCWVEIGRCVGDQ